MALLSLLAAAGLAMASTATAEAAPGDGLTTIAGVEEGATTPTIYPMQRRLAKTDGGRLLALYVPHQGGPQLTWRDPDGAWQTKTTGENTSGRLLAGAASGVNPASIAVGTDAGGEEHAWVVFGGGSTSSTLPVQLRRLSNLDSPDGPSIGPLVELAPSGSKPDIEFVEAPGGASRAIVVWSETLSSTSYKLHVGWLDDLGTDTPALTEQQTLATSAAERLWGTLAVAPDGTTRVIARISGGRIVSFTYQPGTPTGNWTQGADGATATGHGYHSAVTLDSGETLFAVDDVTGLSGAELHQVKVQRFSATGTPAPVELLMPVGYSNPTLSTDGTNAWLVMTRISDGYVVSRRLTAGVGWSTVDQLEIGAEGGGGYSYPNLLRRTHSRLRLLVGGPQGASTSQHSVLFFQRLTGAVADADDDGVPDNCPTTANINQNDNDGDAQGDACDADDDNDTVVDGSDNCPTTANAGQTDTDSDGQGDACDSDDDNDTVVDGSDNCPADVNADQANNDGDGQGNVCDPFPGDPDNDADSDGVGGDVDNCPAVANAGQTDTDSDGQGDACDSDDDNDGVLDASDNCEFTDNADQANNDLDSEGDACDADDDDDGTPDNDDEFPFDDGETTDTDTDTIGDNADNCPAVANAGQTDSDSDGQGDACDPFPGDPDNDADSDGVGGDTDNCPAVANAGQTDSDSDGQGDACDPDNDNDGVLDPDDGCPAQPGPASGNGCPSAGGEIRVDVESPQRQTGKKALVRAAVTCQQACTATGVGTVKISGAGKKTKPIEIGSGSVPLSAGQTTIVTLKPPGPRYARKIHAAIDKGLSVKAKIRFEIDDGRGDLTIVSHKVELT